jgi:hypothetical protein
MHGVFLTGGALCVSSYIRTRGIGNGVGRRRERPARLAKAL